MKAHAAAQPLFARSDFRQVAGETLRPGGLDLTRRGLALADLPPGSLVADLGCGRGATARLLAQAGHRVLALDIAEEDLRKAACRAEGIAAPEQTGLEPARAAAGPLFLRARAQALPLADASLDAAFCECVLSASGAASAVLAEAGRVLKPGGALVLSDLYLRGGAEQVAGGNPAQAADSGSAQHGHVAAAQKNGAGPEQATVSGWTRATDDRPVQPKGGSPAQSGHDASPLDSGDAHRQGAENALAETAHKGCLSGAPQQDELLRALARAGFLVTHFEDHSRLLAELAARLLFAGVPRSALGFACAEGPGGCAGARPGYFLCLARRQGL